MKLRSPSTIRVVAALALCAMTAWADVRVPALFTDHMVLQRGRVNRVWGWADPGEKVIVTINGQTQTTKADAKGKWLVTLDPMPVGGPHTLSITGKNNITVEDVLIGEVWICSGQSNMEWDVHSAKDADLEISTAKFPRMRLISVPPLGTQKPQEDFKGEWKVCSPQTAVDFSAVCYFFGRQLYQTLEVPIGLIDDAWGGSACEAWVRRDILAKSGRYQRLLGRWEALEKEFNPATAEADFQRKLASWREAVRQMQAEGKPVPRRPIDLARLMNGNLRPGNIFNGVLSPTIGYGIRGVIWYQGESNASRAYQYRDLFPLMIKSWRDEWRQGNFSFYWAQLANFMAEKPEPKDSSWAELREAQTMTMKRLPNTGEAVTIDLGEGRDIHPRNKQDVAKRLARWALGRDYGMSNVAYQSPAYRSMEKNGNEIILSFDHVGGGLYTFGVPKPVGFAIAGTDKKFVWADAQLKGTDKIVVTSDRVSDPVSVRYAWADNPLCNVFSREGLPLTPFRTDHWPGVTMDTK